MRLARGLRAVGAAVKRWSGDSAGSEAAALAYYSSFSIAPLIVIAVAIAGAAFGRAAATGEIERQLRDVLGRQGAEAVNALVESAHRSTSGGLATITSAAALLLGSTGVFLQLQQTLNQIWRTPPAPQEWMGLKSLLQKRLLSLGIVLGIGFLLLVSLVASTVVNAAGSWIAGHVPAWEVVLHVGNHLVAFAATALLFALTYMYLPDKHVSWRVCVVPGFVAAALFTLGKLGISWYLARGTVTSSFGAAGSLAVVLVWVYYSAQIMFFGAELSWVLAHPQEWDNERLAQSSPASMIATGKERWVMQLEKIMTRDPKYCLPDTSLSEVARMMLDCDCGEIPVVEDAQSLKPIGVITDRDIVCRAVAQGRNPKDLSARDCMTSPAMTSRSDSTVEACCRQMEDGQVRRIPVVDAKGRLCGIVAQADIARGLPDKQNGVIAKIARKLSQRAHDTVHHA
jgi:membrane protein